MRRHFIQERSFPDKAEEDQLLSIFKARIDRCLDARECAGVKLCFAKGSDIFLLKGRTGWMGSTFLFIMSSPSRHFPKPAPFPQAHLFINPTLSILSVFMSHTPYLRTHSPLIWLPNLPSPLHPYNCSALPFTCSNSQTKGLSQSLSTTIIRVLPPSVLPSTVFSLPQW